MIFEETGFDGCYIITPRKFEDKRGFFFESFNQKEFEEFTNQSINFVQDNISKSAYGVLRGLHFQKGEYAQAKLISVLKGKVLDVIVDLRSDSKTYKKTFQIIVLASK